MTIFYVGQRVRIKWSFSFPPLKGREGLIIGNAGGEPNPTNGASMDWEVKPDGWTSSIHLSEIDTKGRLVCFCPNSSQLEPIVPEGLESNEEIDELFSPNPTLEEESGLAFIVPKKQSSSPL